MQLEVQKKPTLSAFSWIKSGWRVFTLNPSIFMGMSGLLACVALLAVMIPYFNFVALIVMPFLASGFYQVASDIEQEKPVSVSDIFQYFSRLEEYRIFFRVAAVNVLLSLPSVLLSQHISGMIEQQIVPDMSLMMLFVTSMLIQFMFMAFVVQAAWVAPQSSIFDLLKLSFKACWINGLPLLVYGLASTIITLISLPIILIGWLIAYSVLTLMFLHAFLDIFQPVRSTDEQLTSEIDLKQSNQNNEANNQQNKLDDE